jgi:hypothetical protein
MVSFGRWSTSVSDVPAAQSAHNEAFIFIAIAKRTSNPVRFSNNDVSVVQGGIARSVH